MLRRGEMFGATGATLYVNDVTLTETRYAPETHLPSHRHELPMFVLVVRGSYDEAFDRHARVCSPKHLVYRPPGERHSQRFFGAGATCLTIEIGSLAERNGLSGADGRLALAGLPALAALRMYDELRRDALATGLVVEELTNELVALAERRAFVRERRAPHWLRIAREAIDAHPTRPFRIADLARQVSVHPVHLSRTFRRHFGCGIGEYVRRLRVHAACVRLSTTSMRASQVAAETGFTDQSHMGRAFRQVMDRTPREFYPADDQSLTASGGTRPRRSESSEE